MNKIVTLLLIFVIYSAGAQQNDDIGLYVRYNYTKNDKNINLERLFSLKQEFYCKSTVEYKRFIDKKTGLIGLTDQEGNIIIEAKYNGLSAVNNGLIVALKNANKKSYQTFMHRKLKNADKLDCIHITWEDGDLSLMAIEEQLIIENFDYNPYLDLKSVKISDQPEENPSRASFRTLSGEDLSFRDYKLELISNLNSLNIYPITAENLSKLFYDRTYYQMKDRLWVSQSKEALIELNFSVLKEKFEGFNF